MSEAGAGITLLTIELNQKDRDAVTEYMTMMDLSSLEEAILPLMRLGIEVEFAKNLAERATGVREDIDVLGRKLNDVKEMLNIIGPRVVGMKAAEPHHERLWRINLENRGVLPPTPESKI